MSKQVDERVVSMDFDNKNFESNVKTSMSTLDRLKQALQFKDAGKGFNNINTAAKNVNLSSLGNAVEEVKVKFSALQVVATTALANITNSAVNAGKQVVNALTIEPAVSGFEEYETQMGAIQTILSNTRSKGSTLEDVNSALDELNTYADKTIYNFTEMTKNIGTFTAAGVDLDKSVAAIKGIANLGAVSGSTSQQVSTAMYQLSQALATGRVSLMDWNSVVNAGMGGEVFQEALKRTSRVLGTGVDEAIKKYGTFRDSLTKGQWLTSDVLTETLKQLSGAYTEADLMNQGYTEEQAREIVALANDATDAATKVKTFSQLIDTTKEALGSGWTNTWEILIGDFEEAKELFTEISNVLNDSIQKSADARNNLLQGWKDLGGRTELIKGLQYAFEGLVNIVTPIKNAFSNIFPPMTVEGLYNLTASFRDLMGQFKYATEQAGPQLERIFSGIFSVIKIGINLVKSLVDGITSFFTGSSDFTSKLLESAASIGDFFTNIGNAVQQTDILSSVMSTVGNVFGQALSALSNFGSTGLESIAELFSGVGEILSSIGQIIKDAVYNISGGLRDLLRTADFGSILDVFNSGMLAALVTSVRSWFSKLTGSMEDNSKGLLDVLSETVDKISENVTGILDAVRGSLQAWQTNIKADTLMKIASAVGILALSITLIAAIKPEKLNDALGAITVLFLELMGAMTAFTKLNSSFEQMAGISVMTGMATAILILSFAMKSLASLDGDAILRAMAGIAGLATVMTLVAKALSGGNRLMKGAVNLILMAAAMKLLVNVAWDLAQFNWEQLGKGLAGVGGLMLEFGTFSRLLDANGILKASVSLVIVSGALKLMIGIINELGTMDLGILGQGLGIIGAIFAEFAALSRVVPDGKGLVKSAIGIVLISAALNAIVPVFERLANIGVMGVASSLMGMAGAFSILEDFLAPMLELDIGKIGSLAWSIPNLIGSFNTIADAMQKLSSINPINMALSLVVFRAIFEELTKMIDKLDKMQIGDMAAMSVAMPVITSALYNIADAMTRLGGLSVEGALSGILAVMGAMKGLAIGLDAVAGKTGSVAALMVLSVALVALSVGINIIATAGIVGVATSLVALAGTLTVVGVAAKILQPIIPTIFKLSGSLVTLGASLAVLGAGSAVMGFGLITLITGLAGALLTLSNMDPMKAAQGLVILGAAFVTMGVAAKLLKPLVPSIFSLSASIAALGLSCAAVSIGISVLVASLTALGSIGKENAEMLVETLVALVTSFADAIPEIINSLMNSFKSVLLGLLGVISELAPQIAETILKVISETLQSLLEYGPTIVTFAIDFIIQVLNGITARVPELVGAISGLISALVSSISDAMSGWEGGGGLETGLQFFAGVIGLVAAINFVKDMITGAMVGILKLAAFVVELGAIIAAFGALQQIPGLNWIISEGGNLLQTIGTAIGQFIGGIAGGFLEGATSTLPQVATSLSQFGMNIIPFLTAMKFVDQSTLDSVTNLALAIAALSGANFVDAVTSFLSGGQDFSDLGAKLVPFGEAMVDFSNAVQGIDVEAVNAAANCGQALADLSATLPKEGGLAQAIFGETTDFATFGNQLVQFGVALRMYSIAVAGIDVGSIIESAKAGQALSDLSTTLPKEGGLAQAIFGENTDLSTFGAQLVSFGMGLKMYAAIVAGLDVASIRTSVTAGQALSDLSASLGDKDSVFGWLVGGNKQDLSGFGTQLTTFGNALRDYSNSLAEVDFSKITSATVKVNNLVTLIQSAVNLDTTGIDNIASISRIGDAMNTYYNKIVNVDGAVISTSITNLENLKNFIMSLAGFDGSGIESFKNSLTSLGEVSFDSITNVLNNSSLSEAGGHLMSTLAEGLRGSVSVVTTASAEIVTTTKTSITDMSSEYSTAGETLINALADGFGAASSKATTAARSIGSQCAEAIEGLWQRFHDAGYNYGLGFASGISESTLQVRIAAQAMADAAVRAAERTLDENSPSKVMFRVGDYAGLGFANGLSKYVKVSSDVSTKIGTAAVKSLNDSISKVRKFSNTDLEINPVIRPVVNLDDATRSMSLLNSALGKQPTISVAGRIDKIGSTFSQNGSKIASIYAQTDNSDVVDAIDDLGDRLQGASGPTINAPMTVIRRDEDAYVATTIFSRNLMRAAGGVK